jgi:hypothetical protein
MADRQITVRIRIASNSKMIAGTADVIWAPFLITNQSLY